jgi:hypothetical protein
MNFPWLRLRSAAVLLSVIAVVQLLCPLASPAQPVDVTFHISPTVRPQVGEDMTMRTAQIMEFLRTDLGVTLAHPIEIHLYGSRRELFDDLIDGFAIPEQFARAIVADAGYLAIGFNILIDTDTPTFADPSGLTARTAILAHELAHLVHNDLMGGTPRAPRWLREGFAVRMELRALDHFGLRVSTGAIERINLTRFALKRGELVPLVNLEDGQAWTRQIEHVGADRVYSESFVAVDYLVQSRGLDAILAYFRAYRESVDAAENFRKIFGLDVQAFQQELEQHLALPAQ